ncbi:MAG: FxLYD domain-containing protein [Actinomycetota bacterium]
MSARLRVALLLAALLIAGACGKSSPGATPLTKSVHTLQPSVVKITAINAVSATVGSAVYGEVQNLSSSSIGGVQLTLSITQKNGKVVNTPFPASTMLNVIPPGATAPFTFPFDGTGVVAAVSATVQAGSVIPVPYDPLTVGTSTASLLGSAYQVSGTVTNSSGVPITYHNVVATMFDHSGNVVGAADDYGTSDTVTPGGTSNFDIILTGTGHLVARYTLVAEGRVVAQSK